MARTWLNGLVLLVWRLNGRREAGRLVSLACAGAFEGLGGRAGLGRPDRVGPKDSERLTSGKRSSRIPTAGTNPERHERRAIQDEAVSTCIRLPVGRVRSYLLGSKCCPDLRDGAFAEHLRGPRRRRLQYPWTAFPLLAKGQPAFPPVTAMSQEENAEPTPFRISVSIQHTKVY